MFKGAGATVAATSRLPTHSGSWVGRASSLTCNRHRRLAERYSNSPIDGIFLDVSRSTRRGNANVTTYLGYRTYCNQRNLYPVIANPGSNNGTAWFDTPVADVW